MKLPNPMLAVLFSAAIAVSATASAQPSPSADAPKSRAEVKNEVKAARANGELPPDANRSQIGDPPVPKARKPKKARMAKTSASAAK